LSYCWLPQLQLISLPRLQPAILVREVQPTKPRDLAIALLILDRDKYTGILPADYISYIKFQQPSEENGVSDVFKTNRKVTYWIKRVVLSCDQLEKRIELLNFFVDTAKVTGHGDVVIPELITKFTGIQRIT
jgi:hypothetical protein